MSGRPLTVSERARVVLLVSIGLTTLLYLVPYGRVVAYPLMLLSTLAHEMGHGISAVLLGGSFEQFQMWPDGSGKAELRVRDSALAQALVAAGGLVGPAVAAAIGFALGRTERGARVALYALAVLLALALLLVVRNIFGVVFVVIGLAGCSFAAWKASGEIAQLLLVFLAVQLALSVFSRGDYLFAESAQTADGLMPSDVGQMAAALWLPYWFWGLVCGGLSAAVLLYGAPAYWN